MTGNIVQDLITGAQILAVKRSKKKQHKYEIRINENIAIGLFKEQFIKLIMRNRIAAGFSNGVFIYLKIMAAAFRFLYVNYFKAVPIYNMTCVFNV